MLLKNLRLIKLQRLTKLFILISFLAGLYVLLQFSTTDYDRREKAITRLYLSPLETDRAYFFRVEKRQIIVIHYSHQMQQKLFPGSEGNNARLPRYYVALGYGTDMGCPLKVIAADKLKETCSHAIYDFAGRPIDSDADFTELKVPVYNFCSDYSCLNLRI